MMNINILNKVIKGVSEQLPLVNSFYTQSPYESWNVKEVKYGSVTFVVTQTTTNEQTTTYNAVLYYADRLTEDKSNIDSIHSDAATVIQTIVGALNQSDNEYIVVDYPVGITLFEQTFCDELAGGYANITINVEGMGECFNDEYSVPEIIGISSYYTKDEIIELFPLRNQLSTVAYSGSFRDLVDVPDLVTDVQYNNLIESVSNIKYDVNKVKTDKLDKTTFNKWVSDFGSGLSGATPLSEFNAFVQGQNTINMNLAVELKNAVKSQYLDSQVTSLKSLIDTKVSNQSFDNFGLNVNNNFIKIQSDLDTKVGNSTFTNAISGINTRLDDMVNYAAFENFTLGVNNVIVNLAAEVGEKLDADYFDGWKDGLSNTLNTKISKQTFDTVIGNIYTKSEVDNKIANIEISGGGGGTVDLSDYPTKSEVASTYLTKTSASATYYTKSQIDDIVDNIETGGGTVDLDDYYKKTETYNRTEIDNKVNSIKPDLSGYLTKTDASNTYYTKTYIDDIVGDIDSILNSVLYTK